MQSDRTALKFNIHPHPHPTLTRHQRTLPHRPRRDNTFPLAGIDPNLLTNDSTFGEGHDSVLCGDGTGLNEVDVACDFGCLVGEFAGLVAGHSVGSQKNVSNRKSKWGERRRARTYRFFQNARSLRALISAIRFMACNVVCTRSLEYLIGTLRRFSNSNVLSCREGVRR